MSASIVSSTDPNHGIPNIAKVVAEEILVSAGVQVEGVTGTETWVCRHICCLLCSGHHRRTVTQSARDASMTMDIYLEIFNERGIILRLKLGMCGEHASNPCLGSVRGHLHHHAPSTVALCTDECATFGEAFDDELLETCQQADELWCATVVRALAEAVRCHAAVLFAAFRVFFVNFGVAEGVLERAQQLKRSASALTSGTPPWS